MRFDRSTSPARLRARTRAVLGQLVGDVLSAPLDALETRLARHPWLGERAGAAGAPAAGRLREVLDRDRALVAAQPESEMTVSVARALPSKEPAPEQSPAPTQVPRDAVAVTPELDPHDAQEEPIRTRTMARLLGAQGYRARALAIYQALLAESPGDDELRAEAERLRGQSGPMLL
ncbi:MAG TPA: hypothetical protein VFZ61_27450 [Polyangiales bacterium]